MILLTALPRTGKSTAIERIVNMLGVKNCGGFYTKELRENGERVGFGLIVGNNGQVLYANSSVGYDAHIEEYKKGRRTSLD